MILGYLIYGNLHIHNYVPNIHSTPRPYSQQIPWISQQLAQAAHRDDPGAVEPHVRRQPGGQGEGHGLRDQRQGHGETAEEPGKKGGRWCRVFADFHGIILCAVYCMCICKIDIYTVSIYIYMYVYIYIYVYVYIYVYIYTHIYIYL